jgi:hypothetical protein
MYGRFSNREVGCAKNGEVSGSKCEERRECGEMGSVKKEGDSVKKKGKCDDKGEQKTHKQFLCTAPLYSSKHTVVLIRSCSLHSTQPH